MSRDEIIKKCYSNTICKSKLFMRGYNLIVYTAEYRDFKFVYDVVLPLYIYTIVIKHADFSNGKCENYYILITYPATHHII